MCDTCAKLKELLDIERGKTLVLKEIVAQKCNLVFDTNTTPSDIQPVRKKVRKTPDRLPLVDIDVPLSSSKNVGMDDTEPMVVIIEDDRDFGDVIQLKEIEESFTILKDARNYSQLLCNIRQQRRIFQTQTTPSEYADLVLQHVQKAKHAFKDKGWTDKKLSCVLQKFISPLEAFITHTVGYEKQSIELEEIERFKFCCMYAAKTDVFSNEHFSSFISTHALTLFPLSELLKIYAEESGAIIHVPGKDFTFYQLKEVKDGVKYWKMDCRLEYATVDLVYCIRQYAPVLFKTICKDCLKTTHIYNAEYASKFQIMEYQGEQLLHNLFTAMDFMKVNRLFRDVVKMYASHEPTPVDVFDLTSDEPEQDLDSHEEDMTEVVQVGLFEHGITAEEAKEFIKKRIF